MTRKKEISTKTKKTIKKEVKEKIQNPIVEEINIEEVLNAVENKENQPTTTIQMENENTVVEEAKDEIVEEKVDEIHETAIKETFKENNTRLIDRMFGYSWNGQEIEF
jgi:hypothetical protein